MLKLVQLASLGLLLLPATPGHCRSYHDLQFCRVELESARGESAQVNSFILNSGSIHSKPQAKKSLDNLQLNARLLTPLNSNFVYAGYPIKAVVISTVARNTPAVLPPGTILEGFVENSQLNARLSQPGSIFLRFYRAYVVNRGFDVDFIADTADGALHPSPFSQKNSTKEAWRNLLTLSSNIAIPCAIGTSGMSLAITAGAGAVLGAALADDGKYLQGAVRGAWDGAGLNRLDPIVCKGPAVILPQGSIIRVRQTGTWSYPSLPVSAGRRQAPLINYPPLLATSVRLLNSQAPDMVQADSSVQDLQRVSTLIEQKNLAAALQLIEECHQKYPSDQEVSGRYKQLLQMVCGEMSPTK